MEKKNKRKTRIATVIVAVVMLFIGAGVGAAIRWKGSDKVENIKINLVEIRDRLSIQRDKIDDLEDKLEGSVTENDHQAIIDQMQDRYDNDIAAKDAIIQDYMQQVQDLNNEISRLNNLINQFEDELDLAYQDVTYIDNEIESILADTE